MQCCVSRRGFLDQSKAFFLCKKCNTLCVLVRKFPYCKEISPFERKKKETKIVRKKEGAFEANKELKRNSRNKL